LPGSCCQHALLWTKHIRLVINYIETVLQTYLLKSTIAFDINRKSGHNSWFGGFYYYQLMKLMFGLLFSFLQKVAHHCRRIHHSIKQIQVLTWPLINCACFAQPQRHVIPRTARHYDRNKATLLIIVFVFIQHASIDVQGIACLVVVSIRFNDLTVERWYKNKDKVGLWVNTINWLDISLSLHIPDSEVMTAMVRTNLKAMACLINCLE